MPEHPDAADTRQSRNVPPSEFERLQAMITDLRLKLEHEVRTGRVVIVDDTGIARIRLATTPERDCQISLLAADGFERIKLSARPDIGVLTITGRSRSAEPTSVEIFALDPDDSDGSYLGVELIDQGNSVAGFSLYEGHEPRMWTSTDQETRPERPTTIRPSAEEQIAELATLDPEAALRLQTIVTDYLGALSLHGNDEARRRFHADLLAFRHWLDAR